MLIAAVLVRKAETHDLAKIWEKFGEKQRRWETRGSRINNLEIWRHADKVGSARRYIGTEELLRILEEDNKQSLFGREVRIFTLTLKPVFFFSPAKCEQNSLQVFTARKPRRLHWNSLKRLQYIQYTIYIWSCQYLFCNFYETAQCSNFDWYTYEQDELTCLWDFLKRDWERSNMSRTSKTQDLNTNRSIFGKVPKGL